MNTEPLTTLKGIGEKTEKLFAKVGIYNLQQLLHYYPRDYDCYAERSPSRMQTRGKECGIRKNCPQSVGKRKPEKERRCPGTLRGAGAAAAYLV